MTFFEMPFLKMLFLSDDAVLFTDKVCIDLDFECPSVILTVLFKHKVKNDFHAVYDCSALA